MEFLISDNNVLDYCLSIETEQAGMINERKNAMQELLGAIAMPIYLSDITEISVKKVSSDFILTLDVKKQLRLLSKYLSKVALKYQHLQDSIFHSIILLFGMCSSRPAYIYAAIFGSSSTRIFS
ncbi:hypothetical protein TRIP_D300219 [uncultured Paludibacter sp.]|uniref:Uncharacterized protein n=1 Tax=uncultured Paludibacter sp. TaxID=497635 RepID=A0A653ABL6_9BACT|nr:hypothetical protein TRIP_D300219 [uncultured Paludibacter sp.]